MENIKYIKEMIMPDISGGSYVDGYHIVFNVDSELEIFIDVFNNDHYFSTTDCLKGVDRNNFKKNITIDNAIVLVKHLIKILGFVDTNQGKVVIVNNSIIKTQIVI